MDINLQVAEDGAAVDLDIDEAQEVLEKDHSKLENRDAQDSHPEEAITGLAEDLRSLREADKSLTETQKSQGEAITELEKKIILPMTAEEAREILNG